jgi:GntR family transcriptional repressor for pyruvate dehydrogenase complex
MDGLAVTNASPGDAFGPLAPVRLADGVLAALSQAILDGRLKPGEALPSEAALAASFGVSKQVVREAVRQLAALGAVQIGQGRATRVVEMTDAQPLARFWRFAVGSTREGLAEAVEMRRILEPQVARLAAKHATPDGVAALRGALKRMDAALGDVPAWIPADLDFHEQLGRMSGNRLVRLQVQGLRPVIEEVLRHFNSAQRSKADWRRTLARHRRVADAVAAHDGEAAFACMLEHFEAADARLAQLFPRSGA